MHVASQQCASAIIFGDQCIIILNTITDGRQPPDLTAKALTRIRLPDAWQDQSASLQIDP
ncbi:hypothetical protein [Hyphomonas sp.]|jgi:hypothetical protein|uniref:hypothetical protein n=1 Tax=Hyphomonas sp. TaxID=87 RepID=UPI0032D9A784